MNWKKFAMNAVLLIPTNTKNYVKISTIKNKNLLII
ncbi:hypothetical protein vBEcoMWL3_gp095c [Escherichia phage vB_EcoM_WL-3]|nr:hypothetical protein vBEcoMWL3_gp095c [Escherichia phage vB_EcoM_WL-3]